VASATTNQQLLGLSPNHWQLSLHSAPEPTTNNQQPTTSWAFPQTIGSFPLTPPMNQQPTTNNWSGAATTNQQPPGPFPKPLAAFPSLSPCEPTTNQGAQRRPTGVASATTNQQPEEAKPPTNRRGRQPSTNRRGRSPRQPRLLPHTSFQAH